MTRIAQSYWQAEQSRAAEGIIPGNLLYELYPWFRISINMFSVKEGCAGFCFKFPSPFSTTGGLEGDFIFETVTVKLCSLSKK
jgi:hypothetical protein